MQMVGVGFSIRQAQDPEPVEGLTDALLAGRSLGEGLFAAGSCYSLLRTQGQSRSPRCG